MLPYNALNQNLIVGLITNDDEYKYYFTVSATIVRWYEKFMISVNPRCLLPPFVIEENAKTHLEITENKCFFFFSPSSHTPCSRPSVLFEFREKSHSAYQLFMSSTCNTVK